MFIPRRYLVAKGFGAHVDEVQERLREAVAQRESAMQRRLEEFLGELTKASRRTEETITARGREDATAYHKVGRHSSCIPHITLV